MQNRVMRPIIPLHPAKLSGKERALANMESASRKNAGQFMRGEIDAIAYQERNAEIFAEWQKARWVA